MKVNIFDYYDENTENLLQSLKTAKLPRKSLFVHYNGRLPKDAMSPFTFFTGLKETNTQGLFFNRVAVPAFYDIIVGGANSARIENGMRTVGLITFRSEGYRVVDNVTLFSKEDGDTVVRKDWYNISGDRYATTYFKDGEQYATRYFKDGQPVITENHRSGIIELRYQDKTYDFANITAFFVFFLQEAKINALDIVINSLSYPLFIAHTLHNEKTTLFWQEPLGDDVPGNMVAELENQTSFKQIIFSDESQLKFVSDRYPDTKVKLTYLSNIGEFARKTKYRHQAFVLTNSDDLRGLDEILTALPDLKVTVAAFTEMSKKLLEQGDKYQNLSLLPNFAPREVHLELEKADIYLDINAGGKVANVLRYAYRNHMIILTDQDVKAGRYKSLVYDGTNALIADLTALLNDKTVWDDKLRQMISQNGPVSTATNYRKLLR